MTDLPAKVTTRIRQMRTVQRAKSHFERNKKYYITGVSCLAVGAMIGLRASDKVSVEQRADMFKLLHLQYKSPNVNNLEQTTVLVRRGHPGNVVKCLDTGEVFASQNRAAASTGVSAGVLSKHLSGKAPDAKGLRFETLGEAV